MLKSFVFFTAVSVFSQFAAAVVPTANPIALTVTDPNIVRIELLASDDGLPGPLVYIITALPEHGTIFDPEFGEIAAVPYLLQNTIHSVDYQPCIYASGTDRFSFIANDGGTPPDGGDSNEADVVVTFDYNASVYAQSTAYFDYPFYTSREDCRMQTIYLAGEFGKAKQINGMEFRIKRVPGLTLSNLTIRMQHTDLSVYPTGPDFVNTGWTVVYQANHSIPAVGWHSINFQTPFYYNGADNVLVDVSFNNASLVFSPGQCYSFAAPGRSIYQVSRNMHGDPLLWTAAMFAPTGCLLQNSAAVLKLHGAPTVDPILSDFNVNCSVGLEDLLAFVGAWMALQGDGVYDSRYDIASPADHVINMADFAVLASEWLSTPYDLPPVYPIGDFNESGEVDLSDLMTLMDAWLTQAGQLQYNADCDISAFQDQVINFADFAVFSTHWMEAI